MQIGQGERVHNAGTAGSEHAYRAATAAPTSPPTLGDDILQGIKTIADFLGIQERTAYHLASTGRLPGAFKLGRLWYARRSTLVENIRALEKGEA